MDFIEDLKTEMHRLIIRDRKEIPHIILAEGVNLPFNETTGMANNNVIIVGSSGMGKTACLIIPNILEGYQCPIISDPKGSIFSEYEKEITDLYDVRILNLKDISNSCCYNPLKYCKTDDDILFISHFIAESNGSGKMRVSNDSFWGDSAMHLLSALISFVVKNFDDEYKTMNSVIELYLMLETPPDIFFSKKDVEENRPSIDKMFENNKDKDPFSWQLYSQFYKTSDKTRMSILSSLGDLLLPWMLPELQSHINTDELNLYDFAEGKKINGKYPALVIIADDINPEKNFLATIIYFQMLKILCNYADSHESKLDVPARFYLDDFSTVGIIPHFDSIISNIRSRNISVMLAIQNESQLEQIYGNAAKTIIGNCNFYVYMGSSDIIAKKEMSIRFSKTLPEIRKMSRKDCYIDFGSEYKICKKYTGKIKKNKTRIITLQDSIKNHVNNKRYIFSNYEPLSTIHYINNIMNHIIDSHNIYISYTTTFGYKLRKYVFDSRAEYDFYSLLKNFLTDYKKYVSINIHVHLSDIFEDIFVEKKTGAKKYRLINMHCDYLISDLETREPLIAIELDGPHHEDEIQKERDEFKDKLFYDNNIPLYRLSVEELDKRNLVLFFDIAQQLRKKYHLKEFYEYEFDFSKLYSIFLSDEDEKQIEEIENLNNISREDTGYNKKIIQEFSYNLIDFIKTNYSDNISIRTKVSLFEILLNEKIVLNKSVNIIGKTFFINNNNYNLNEIFFDIVITSKSSILYIIDIQRNDNLEDNYFKIKKYILDIIKYEYAIAQNNKSSLSLSNEDKDMLKIILDIWDNKLKED